MKDVSASTQKMPVREWLRKDTKKIKHIKNTSEKFKTISLY